MSNPNTNALSLSNRRGQSSFSLSSSGMRVIHIGKDQQPVTLPRMTSVNGQSWKKAASFSTLDNLVYSLVDAHSVADVISLVSNELPLDTGSAFQEAESAVKMIVDSTLFMNHLEPLAFLTSTGKGVKVDETEGLEYRPEDITFFKFRCTMDSKSVDERVTTVPDLSFQLCLKLPRHTYNVSENTITLVKSLQITAPNSGTARALLRSFESPGKRVYLLPIPILFPLQRCSFLCLRKQQHIVLNKGITVV